MIHASTVQDYCPRGRWVILGVTTSFVLLEKQLADGLICGFMLAFLVGLYYRAFSGSCTVPPAPFPPLWVGSKLL